MLPRRGDCARSARPSCMAPAHARVPSAGLSTSTSSDRKRRESAQETNSERTGEAKRLCRAIDSMADEFVCAITQELPVDPVTAEDGRVYERNAIETWIHDKTTADEPLKSPITNKPMGPVLLPSVQTLNVIKAMIESGAVCASKAGAWKQRVQEQQEVSLAKEQVLSGKGDAASQIAIWYLKGQKGLARDASKALEWYKRGADLGSATSNNGCANLYSKGIGVDKNYSMALYHWMVAASKGSVAACFHLGSAFARGDAGVLADFTIARRYFERVLKGVKMSPSLMGDHRIESVKEWLRVHDITHQQH